MSINPKVIEYARIKDKASTAKIMWILLGWLGIHHFMFGNIIRGLLTISLTVGFWYKVIEMIIVAFQSEFQAEDVWLGHGLVALLFLFLGTLLWVSDYFFVIRRADRECNDFRDKHII